MGLSGSRRWLLPLVGLLLAGGAAWWLFGRSVAVTVVPVTRGKAAEIVYASGEIEPVEWARVTPLVRARIVDSCDCEGEAVRAGRLLVALDDAQVVAELDELKARLDLARRELERAAGLLERRAGTVATYDAARASVQQLEASITAAELRRRDYRIEAPISGTVLRLDANRGEIAEPGTALGWVGRPRPLRVVADVNEEDIPRVVKGQKALLKADAFPGKALDATVASITPQGDPDLRTYRVRLSLPDDTPLMIGMTAQVNFIVHEVEDALIVPTAAISQDAVWVVRDGRAARRPVKIGIRSAERLEVTDGVTEGEQVVVPVPLGLVDGAAVRITVGGS